MSESDLFVLPKLQLISGIFTICVLATSCSLRKTEVVWEVNLPKIGSQSSVRTIDLNADGVKDIVMGAGENEYVQSNHGILAFDGKTGAIIWEHASDDLIFGSATFLDITSDGTPDVLIGGRSCQLMAIEGKTGNTIWAYQAKKYENDPVLKYARYNFYSGSLVPDQNKDGILDLLVQNGGNPKIGPNISDGRYPGVLMVIDSKTGNVIAGDTIPDGQESYMSPLCYKQSNSDDYVVVFGSGGETLDGHLYLAPLSDLMNKQLSKAKIIATDSGHGFIAPPVLADITGDGILDIVAISHSSKIFAIDGQDQTFIWRQEIPQTESSNSFAVDQFTSDEVPDFFTFVSKGEWPNNTGSLQILIDGITGDVIFRDSIGCTGFSSPISYDLNKDGRSEAIISINDFDCQKGFSGDVHKIRNELLAIDFSTGERYVIDQLQDFKNIFTSPWIGDLDNDGYLDIIHCQYYHGSSYITAFLGMRIKRISTHIKIRNKVGWGGYMGTDGDGIFH